MHTCNNLRYAIAYLVTSHLSNILYNTYDRVRVVRTPHTIWKYASSLDAGPRPPQTTPCTRTQCISIHAIGQKGVVGGRISEGDAYLWLCIVVWLVAPGRLVAEARYVRDGVWYVALFERAREQNRGQGTCVQTSTCTFI